MAQFLLFNLGEDGILIFLVKLSILASFSLLIALLVYLERQPKSLSRTQCEMLAQEVYELCRSDKSVSSELAKDPQQSPRKIVHRLYFDKKAEDIPSNAVAEVGEKRNDLRRAYECGNWGPSRPSDLFLRIYHDALCTLKRDHLAGVVSPSLMGSCGVLPLTIVAPLPDLCRHVSNCIVRAEKEVFLGTNFWVFSDASTLVTNAFRELSRRAGERGTKVVVKIIYDRGNIRQLSDSRQRVTEKEYTGPKVKLPPPEDIPNIDLEIINYHRPMLGTFHAKFMIVDRRIALLQSSNFQDNDNLEMMVQVEGPIVDSFYDMAIITWEKPFDPPLPMLGSPAADVPPPTFSTQQTTQEADENVNEPPPEHTTKDPHYDPDIGSEAKKVNGTLEPRGNETRTEAVTRHLNTTLQPSTTGDAPESDQDQRMKLYVLHRPHEPFPMAMVNRVPWGALNHTSTYTPQNVAFLSAIQHAKRTVFIQTPNMNADPILKEVLDAVRRGVIVTCYLCLGYNDHGELLPFQNGTNEMVANRLYGELRTDEEKARLRIYNYVAKDHTRPVNNKYKRRSCHVKLMIVDERVAIQGNGNLDTQSFYHSQEVNLLLDSPQICRDWLDTINRNQNTAAYGAVDPRDGCWHDPVTGEMAKGSIGVDPGRFSWAKGVVGAIRRVKGAGGF